MGKALGKRGIWSLCGVLAGVLMTTAAAKAEVTSDLSASVVVWPKVVSNELRDTVIQIANTSNNLVHVHCFYVDASPLFPDQPVHPIFNPRRWQETDFLLWLTRQQPYHWVASQGRPVNPTDDPGEDGDVHRDDQDDHRRDAPHAALEVDAVVRGLDRPRTRRGSALHQHVRSDQDRLFAAILGLRTAADHRRSPVSSITPRASAIRRSMSCCVSALMSRT